MTVEPVKTSVLAPAHGEEPGFACLPGAQAMLATVHERVAVVLVP